ncbi:MAG: hypothetical protein WD397_13115 [Wenzhouxiangellaceae bacterium]
MPDPDPHDQKDDDTIDIKPLMFTGTILLSAGAGLAAGLLICWLFGCGDNCGDNHSDEVRTSAVAIESNYESKPPTEPYRE